MANWLFAVVGVVAALLGGLWLLQGTGLVVMDPIACVGACEALTGPHAGWALAGLALLLAGLGLVWWALRRMKRG